MEISERELEDMIFNSSDDVLESKGLPLKGKRFRQLKIGAYGILDIMTVERDKDVLNITVYELKKGDFDLSTVSQAARYVTGIRHYLQHRGTEFNVKIVLIGERCNYKNDNIFLLNLIDRDLISGYEYSFDIDGLRLDETELCIFKNDAFKIEQTENIPF